MMKYTGSEVAKALQVLMILIWKKEKCQTNNSHNQLFAMECKTYQVYHSYADKTNVLTKIIKNRKKVWA